jgi:hypothetical protein
MCDDEVMVPKGFFNPEDAGQAQSAQGYSLRSLRKNFAIIAVNYPA